MTDNLIQKRGESTWYCRLAVPADVQKRLGCKVFVQSLKTGLRREAMDRRLPLLTAWKAQIKAARDGRQLPEGWQDEMLNLRQEIGDIFQGQKRALIGDVAPELPKIDPAIETKMKGNPRLVAAFESFVKGHIGNGVAGKIQLLDELSDGFKALIPKILTRKYDLPRNIQEEVRSVLDNPAMRKSKSPITPARVKAYRTFRETRGGSQKHIDQQVGKMERLSEFLKSETMSLDFDTIDKWLQSLDRAPNTLAQYLMAGTAFWKWAIKYDAGWRVDFKDKANPFIGHNLPQGGGSATAGEERKIYTTEDTAKLYLAAKDVNNEPLANLILLGWYGGARIEELCKLRTQDVISVDGIRCLDIQRGKNKASKRVLPIHPSLLSVVDRMVAESQDGFLIPVSTENQYGKRSHGISKAFGRLRTAAGFGPLYVFHSFRHGVVTALIRADIPEALVQELVGHETGNVTHDTYSKGATAKQKLNAISKIKTLKVMV